MRRLLPAILSATLSATLVAAVSTACTAALSPDARTIAIAVRRGPIAPVGQPGVDNTAPVAGAEIRIRSGGRTIATTSTDTAGRASVTVEPGSYTADVTRCPGAMSLPAPEPFAVPLAPGGLRLECDTGIR